MTHDDIIRMAREAGFKVEDFDGTLEVFDGDGYIIQTEEMEKFAALVAAHEREQCAKVCEEGGVDESGRMHVQAWGAAKNIRARGGI